MQLFNGLGLVFGLVFTTNKGAIVLKDFLFCYDYQSF